MDIINKIDSTSSFVILFTTFYVLKRFIPNQSNISLAISISLLNTLASFWKNKVTEIVPEPYLDEIFHIPQAQAYCNGNFNVWNPKITTPPGLYIFTSLKALLLGRLFGKSCTVNDLRSSNCLLLLSTFICACNCRIRITQSRRDSIHTAFNIALFPPLFFFSGLFYTDVLSTCSVLVVYLLIIDRTKVNDSIRRSLLVLVFGIISVATRQTNIFWVAVYAAGIKFVNVLDSINFHANRSNTRSKKCWQFINGRIHDISLNEATPLDFLLCVLSVILTATCHPLQVLTTLWPHIFLVILFGGFVFWNGGVALDKGDKNNHVVTIHIPQMLYVWAFFVFFSAPILIPTVLRFLAKIKYSILDNYRSPQLLFKTVHMTAYLIGTLVTSLLIIRYNTVIHPFTLADNRHYMFYIFRYTILRYPVIRFLLVPIYLGCSCLVYLSLHPQDSVKSQYELKNNGFKPKTLTKISESSGFVKQRKPTTSLIVILLATMTMSLVTTSLVEPRYFIIPWIMWRLNLPLSWSQTALSHKDERARISTKITNFVRKLHRSLKSPQYLLWLETAWFLSINFATGYIFLYKGYDWPQEPMKLQRFMW